MKLTIRFITWMIILVICVISLIFASYSFGYQHGIEHAYQKEFPQIRFLKNNEIPF